MNIVVRLAVALLAARLIGKFTEIVIRGYLKARADSKHELSDTTPFALRAPAERSNAHA